MAARPVNFRDNVTINAASRQGVEIQTEKKFAAGSNRQHANSKNVTKLDEETDEFKHNTVSLDVGRLIMQGRQAANLTQSELATKINEKSSIIAEYEQGKAIPNQTILAKLERALNLRLRGKEKGTPLNKPKK